MKGRSWKDFLAGISVEPKPVGKWVLIDSVIVLVDERGEIIGG